jgi:hypothetical protein
MDTEKLGQTPAPPAGTRHFTSEQYMALRILNVSICEKPGTTHTKERLSINRTKPTAIAWLKLLFNRQLTSSIKFNG